MVNIRFNCNVDILIIVNKIVYDDIFNIVKYLAQIAILLILYPWHTNVFIYIRINLNMT